MAYEDNELCEICQVYENQSHDGAITFDLGWWYVINQHCIDLRRNREAREHKNTKPKLTVF